MTAGLGLVGTYPVGGFLSKGPTPSELLAKVQEWLTAREGDELVTCGVVEGPEGEVLLAQLHPFAEELQIACPRLGQITLNAMTATCGPGYHEHACELAHALAAELKVTWRADEDSDDTGFFASGDRAALEAAIVEACAELARESSPAGAGAPPLLFLPASSPAYVHDGAASTPLGPRDAAWLAKAREGDACVLDALPWRTRGRGAEHHLSRALALLWCEVRWREPRNEAEEDALGEVSRCLGLARDAGATAIPWREWSSILGWLGDEDAAREAAAKAQAPAKPLGYRRGDVLPRLPGDFTLRVPGSFTDEMDEDGTWHGTDGPRAVFANAGRIAPQADMPGDAVRALARRSFPGEPFEHRGERVVMKGGLREDEDDEGKAHVLACGAAEGSVLLRASIIFRDPSDRDWAVAVFRSIDRGRDVAAERRGGLPGITG